MTDKTEQISALIDEELNALEKQAVALADQYWQKHWAVRSECERKHWGYIGVRVRTVEKAPYINWYRARYWQSRNKANKKRSPTLEHLKKGQGYAYPASTFRRVKAKQWEIDKAMELEGQFKVIRQQVAMLGKVRRYLSEYHKITGERPVSTSPAEPETNPAASATETPIENPQPDADQEANQDPGEPQIDRVANDHPPRHPGSAESPI